MPIVVPYDRDPAMHREIQHPIADALRRDTGLDNLILYHHACHGSFVVALTDGERNVDIEILPTVDDRPSCDRARFQKIVHRLRNLIDRAEAVKQVKAHFGKELVGMEDRKQRYYEALRRVYHDINRRHGPLQADKWASRTSEHACKPQLDKQLVEF